MSNDKIQDNDKVAAPKNVFQILDGGKAEQITPEVSSAAETEVPQTDYVIATTDGQELYASGFLIFTSQHIAVMQERPGGFQIPVLVVPLDKVRFTELVEENEATVELPF